MCGGCGLARQCWSTSNLSAVRRAKCTAISRCSWDSTCTAKAAPGPKATAPLLLFDRHHKSSGGSSDTELKEFAVMPTGSPSGRTAVITVTPVANSPKASRSCRCVKEVLTGSPLRSHDLGRVRHPRCAEHLAVGGRRAPPLFRDAVARRDLGRDQGLAAHAHESRVARQRVDDAAVELRRLPLAQERLVLLRAVAAGRGGAL